MAFWHRHYRQILEDVRSQSVRTAAVDDFLLNPLRRSVILRHDVDRAPGQACRLALLEQQAGVRSTYYFRAAPTGEFPQEAVRRIAALGHEVGYHYEDLSASGGDMQAAMARFSRNLASLRRLAEVRTVSMHGAPLSPHDNQRLGDVLDLAAHGLLGDAVASIEPYAPFYLTDTGGSWRAAGARNLRDRLGQPWPAQALPSDRAALRRFLASADQPLYLSTHPERWHDALPGYLWSSALDAGANTAKAILAWRRGRRHRAG